MSELFSNAFKAWRPSIQKSLFEIFNKMLLLFSLMFLSLLPGQKFVQARGRGNIPKKRAKTCNYDPSICSVTEDCVVTSEVKYF